MTARYAPVAAAATKRPPASSDRKNANHAGTGRTHRYANDTCSRRDRRAVVRLCAARALDRDGGGGRSARSRRFWVRRAVTPSVSISDAAAEDVAEDIADVAWSASLPLSLSLSRPLPSWSDFASSRFRDFAAHASVAKSKHALAPTVTYRATVSAIAVSHTIRVNDAEAVVSDPDAVGAFSAKTKLVQNGSAGNANAARRARWRP